MLDGGRQGLSGAEGHVPLFMRFFHHLAIQPTGPLRCLFVMIIAHSDVEQKVACAQQVLELVSLPQDPA
jgi:hypothetical protein